MDIREKLVELMIEAKKADTEDAPFSEFLADLMIDHGVTVQQWIPVSERLPEDSADVLVCHKNGSVTTNAWLDAHWWFKDDKNPITHWLPLPQPPKGVSG